MKALADLLNHIGILPSFMSCLEKGETCWVVGGAVRDLLQGDKPHDIDIATPRDPTPLARSFARNEGWSWFYLDRERLQIRMVKHVDGQKFLVDFAPLRADTLEADLQLRDFTCNAIAVPLSIDGLGEVIDPLNGVKDLHGRCLRLCSDSVLVDDPLRILKGVRHVVENNLAIEPLTLTRMKEASSQINDTAPERIRAELARILASKQIVDALDLMLDLNLLPSIFNLSLIGRRIDFRTVFDPLIEAEGLLLSRVGAHSLERQIEEGISVYVLVRLFVLIRVISDPNSTINLRQLRLSRRVVRNLSGLFHLSREKGVHQPQNASARGKALWISRWGGDPTASALYLLMNGSIEPDWAVMALRAFDRHSQNGRIPDLVDGRWIGNSLKIQPGPRMGRLLCAVREGEMRGEIHDLQGAHDFLRLNFSSDDGSV